MINAMHRRQFEVLGGAQMVNNNPAGNLEKNNTS